jgi:hypothetical protein
MPEMPRLSSPSQAGTAIIFESGLDGHRTKTLDWFDVPDLTPKALYA